MAAIAVAGMLDYPPLSGGQSRFPWLTDTFRHFVFLQKSLSFDRG
jgi:hypothetical protein